MVTVMKECINVLISGEGGHYNELSKLYSKLSSSQEFTRSSRFIVVSSQGRSYLDLEHIALKEVRDKNSVFSTLIRLPFSILFNTFSFLNLAKKYRINALISTGPGACIIPIIIAKLILRSKVVHVETMCKFEDLSLSGKVIKPFCDYFVVQNKQLLKYCNDIGIYGGRL
ncbi:PssD/Cps14F family polysaccharide biosynthesis glycosyltransferase [Vibrio vulnificus]|uniref:PssD/Cps14F family polysaccharide biosynthesis glycosyltransferase n=1 Tax=Vibrio vulnificus TaxID=672 RepID=UPI001A18EEEB|nr:hypothetical protein [Vibrio vulnificus]